MASTSLAGGHPLECQPGFQFPGPNSTHIAQALTALKQQRSQDVVAFCSGTQRQGHQMHARVAAVSRGLRRLGVAEGHRVAIAALNSQCYLEGLLAVSAAGAIVALLNPRWSVEEAGEALRQVGASALIVDQECSLWWGPLSASCPHLRLGLAMGGPSQDASSLHSPGLASLEALAEETMGSEPLPLELHWAPAGIAVICFTSGTTGAPKGVALSHEALVSQSLAKIAVVGYSSQDVYLHTAPLCHIGGLSSALALLMAAGTHVFLPRFRADAVREAMEAHRVTALIAVPAMLADLVMPPPPSGSPASVAPAPRFEHVRTLLVGGGGMPAAMEQAVEACFPAARITLAYGMTEACSSMTFQLVRESPQLQTLRPHRLGGQEEGRPAPAGASRGGICVGTPAPHVEVCIAPLSVPAGGAAAAAQGGSSRGAGAGADGAAEGSERGGEDGEIPVRFGGARDGGPSEEGEIWTRGPHVMKGYWGRPADTWRALRSDGWLRTGDVGHLDERGRLWLCGRVKDTVRTGGENVYASEVEAALCSHPAVRTAAVVGVPDGRLGEAVAALITLEPGWHWEADSDSRQNLDKAGFHELQVSLQSLRLHCQSSGLSRFKVPRMVATHEGSLPTTSSGKVRKEVVKNLLVAKLAELQQQDELGAAATGLHGRSLRATVPIRLSRL